jgi:hypothetical protein
MIDRHEISSPEFILRQIVTARAFCFDNFGFLGISVELYQMPP